MESGLKYPTFDIKIKHEGQKAFVFDQIRKKWLQLNPEEWVRQHYINYLILDKGVPSSLISVEKEIELNGTRKRYDVVIYNNNRQPIVLIECKAPSIEITETTVEQVVRYNLILDVNYLVLTNGLKEVVIFSSTNITNYLTELPNYNEL